MTQTIRFSRRHLPHWEVEQGRYFVTVRCTDSLPAEALLRLKELHANLSSIEPHSDAFVILQRQVFRILEKYLDAGAGSCLLHKPDIARMVIAEFASLACGHVDVPHYTVMPNHWHALIVPRVECTHSLSTIMKRLKGRTAKQIRRLSGGSGPVWQREWFDRWMRKDSEWEKCLAYIRENPVKAGVASHWTKHPWTR